MRKFQNNSDGKNLEKYIAENRNAFENMREDAFDFISTMSNSKELKKLKAKYKNPEGDVNMCRAIAEMVANGEKRGIKLGKSEGIMIAKRFMQMKIAGKSNEEIAKECKQPLETVEGFFGDIENVSIDFS